MGSGDDFDFAGTIAAEQAAEYLERLAAGIRAGRIALGAGERKLSLAPSDMLKLEVEAESEGGKGSLAFELSWKPAETPPPTLEIIGDALEVDAGEADEQQEDATQAGPHTARRRR
jgi:amphi-Trp domain-containing protein